MTLDAPGMGRTSGSTWPSPESTGNAALVSVVERLWQEQHAPVFALLSERTRLGENWRATLSGHVDILKAIRGADRKAARDSMRAHLQQVLEVMTGAEERERAGA